MRLFSLLLLLISACAAAQPVTVYLAPNTHGTVSGWLVDFDSERSHVVNNYISHMDRVASDPNYAMAFSEVPNLMVMLQFAPERLPQLQQQVREGRLELVNGFFLEPSISLSGGEALVRMGVLGLRWYDEVFAKRPRFAWMIDVCNTHRQMPQIVSGLGLEALFFSRNNPAPKSTFWWRSPDGSRTLAVCLGRGYASTSKIFSTKEPLSGDQMATMHKFFEEDLTASASPSNIFVMVGGGDYSLAPRRPTYPTELIEAWHRRYSDMELRFSVPGAYVDAIQREVRSGAITLPEYVGDTAHSYNAFWINMPEVKLRYRQEEHRLAAAEMLATAASLRRNAVYPTQDLYHAWILMLMNMDRNILWGAGAGVPFDDTKHWNAFDRFDFVRTHAGSIALQSLDTLGTAHRSELLAFNPLNWERTDPVELTAPAGQRPAGIPCESHNGGLVCTPKLPSTGLSSIALENGTAPAPKPEPFTETISTARWTLKLDAKTGAILSLRDKASGKEFLGGPANVIQAESVAGVVKDPTNWMVARPRRHLVDSSSNHEVKWTLERGPLSTRVTARSELLSGSTVERTLTLYRDYPRIDFETTLDLHSPNLVMTVDFPLSGAVVERTRGIPYGYSSVDPRNAPPPYPYFLMGDHKVYGFSDAIAAAVRWSDYTFAQGGGLALLDRGLPCHEFNPDTVTLALVNAQSSYRGLTNRMLTGQGRRTFHYALWPHTGTWQSARIPRHAWEYNTPLLTEPGRAVKAPESYLETSPNVIVEAMRRVGNDIEVRLVETDGRAAEARVALKLPHSSARRTNLMGEQPQSLHEQAGAYHFPIKPQQIVTLRFRTASAVPVEKAIRAWDPLVPSAKLGEFRQRHDLRGYPGSPDNKPQPAAPPVTGH